MDIHSLKKKLRFFSKKRDWGQFHSPKNLSMALAAECGELLEIFQWLKEDQIHDFLKSGEDRCHVCDEIGDIFLYLIMLSDKLNIDPLVAAEQKIKKNYLRYPTQQVKGLSRKSDLESTTHPCKNCIQE